MALIVTACKHFSEGPKSLKSDAGCCLDHHFQQAVDYSINPQSVAVCILASEATSHYVGRNMRRQRPQQSSEAKCEENPFKRRGPGAAYAAPLAFSSADMKTAPVAHAFDHGVQGKELEQRQPCKRSRTVDGAGPSTAVMESTDNMQPDVFPRCRISSTDIADDPSEMRDSDSDDPQYLDSSKQSRQHGGTHHEVRRASPLQTRPDRSSSTIKKRKSIRAAANDLVTDVATTYATPGMDEALHGFAPGTDFCAICGTIFFILIVQAPYVVMSILIQLCCTVQHGVMHSQLA